MQLNIEHLAEDLWVFGYGSLIWRPGFDHLERHPARLIGAHRALCVFSHVHRGTPERPGLVLGLDFGGACRGVAYRVAANQRADTIAYLRAREQATSVYRETLRSVTLLTEPERRVSALVYMIDRGPAAERPSAGEAARAPGVDADIGGHAGAQRRLARPLDQPQPHRQALHHLHPVAARHSAPAGSRTRRRSPG
jgi:cation transport regulator ChaC